MNTPPMMALVDHWPTLPLYTDVTVIIVHGPNQAAVLVFQKAAK